MGGQIGDLDSLEVVIGSVVALRQDAGSESVENDHGQHLVAPLQLVGMNMPNGIKPTFDIPSATGRLRRCGMRW